MELIPRPEHLVPYAVVRCSWVYPSPSFPPGPISVFDGAILTTCVNSSQPILPISSYTSDPNASARSPAFSSGTPMQHGLCSTESTTGINCLIQSPASSSPATGSGRSLLMTPGQISSPVLSATDSPSSTGPSLLNRPPNPLGASTCSTRSDGGGLCQVSCKGASSSPHLRSTVSGHVETGELGLLARLRALNASSEVISQLGQPMHTSIGGQASAPLMTVRDQTCSSHLSGASTPSGPSPDKSSCSPAVPQASCLSAFFLGCCYLVPPSAGPPSPSKTPSLPSQSSSSSTPTAELGKAPSESLTGVSPSLTVTSTLSTLPKSDSSDSSQPHLETGSNHATEEAGVEGPSTPTFTDIHLALRIYTHRPAGSLICFDGIFHPFWRVVGFVPQSSLLFELAGYKPPKGTAHSSVSSPSKPTKLDLTCMAPLIWPTDHQTTGESPLSSLQSSSPSNFSSSSNSQVVTSNVESSLGTSLFPTSPAVPQTTGQLPRDREWFISTPRPTQIGLDSAVSNLSFQGHQGLEISRFSGYAANYLRLHAHDLISQKGDFSRFCEALKNDELACVIQLLVDSSSTLFLFPDGLFARKIGIPPFDNLDISLLHAILLTPDSLGHRNLSFTPSEEKQPGAVSPHRLDADGDTLLPVGKALRQFPGISLPFASAFKKLQKHLSLDQLLHHLPDQGMGLLGMAMSSISESSSRPPINVKSISRPNITPTPNPHLPPIPPPLPIIPSHSPHPAVASSTGPTILPNQHCRSSAKLVSTPHLPSPTIPEAITDDIARAKDFEIQLGVYDIDERHPPVSSVGITRLPSSTDATSTISVDAVTARRRRLDPRLVARGMISVKEAVTSTAHDVDHRILTSSFMSSQTATAPPTGLNLSSSSTTILSTSADQIPDSAESPDSKPYIPPSSLTDGDVDSEEIKAPASPEDCMKWDFSSSGASNLECVQPKVIPLFASPCALFSTRIQCEADTVEGMSDFNKIEEDTTMAKKDAKYELEEDEKDLFDNLSSSIKLEPVSYSFVDAPFEFDPCPELCPSDFSSSPAVTGTPVKLPTGSASNYADLSDNSESCRHQALGLLVGDLSMISDMDIEDSFCKDEEEQAQGEKLQDIVNVVGGKCQVKEEMNEGLKHALLLQSSISLKPDPSSEDMLQLDSNFVLANAGREAEEGEIVDDENELESEEEIEEEDDNQEAKVAKNKSKSSGSLRVHTTKWVEGGGSIHACKSFAMLNNDKDIDSANSKDKTSVLNHFASLSPGLSQSPSSLSSRSPASHPSDIASLTSASESSEEDETGGFRSVVLPALSVGTNNEDKLSGDRCRSDRSSRFPKNRSTRSRSRSKSRPFMHRSHRIFYGRREGDRHWTHSPHSFSAETYRRRHRQPAARDTPRRRGASTSPERRSQTSGHTSRWLNQTTVRKNRIRQSRHSPSHIEADAVRDGDLRPELPERHQRQRVERLRHHGSDPRRRSAVDNGSDIIRTDNPASLQRGESPVESSSTMNYVEGKRLRLDSEGNSSEAGYTGSIAFANSTYYLPYLAHAASLSYPMLSRPRSKPTTLARKSNFYSRATRSPLRNHPVEGQVASVAEVSINADVDSKMTASQALQFASLALPSPSFSLVNISSHGTPNDHLPAHTALSSDNLTNTDSDHSISNNPASKINIKLNSSQNTVTTRPEDFRRTEVAATATAAAEAAAAVAASSTSGSGPKRTTFEQLELADLAEQVLPAGPRLEDQDCRELERRLMELLEEDEELTRKKQILTELALREAEVARKRQELHRLERNLKSARRLKQDDLATESSTSRQNKRDNPNPGLHEMAGKQMCQRTGQPGPAPVREHLSNRTDKINQEVKSTRDLTDESSSRKEKADCDDRLRGMKSQQHNQPGSVGSPESQLCNNPVDSSLEGENELLILSIANSDTESLEEKQSVSNTNTDTTSSDALSPISAARNSDKPRSEASSILMHSRSLRTRQNGLPLLSLRVAGSSVGLASGALAHYSRPPALMSLHLPVASRHPRPATSLIVTPPIQPTQHSPVDRPPVSISYYVPPEAKRPVPGPRNLIDTLSYNRELFTGPKTEPTTSIPMPGRHTSLLGPPKLP